ncbi:MAG: hypothetical protein PHE30_02190 [Candidatus Omnitrophica bacterium]|nr:hypothetical protein [Candidatus Omnitrophota bacterium]MDD5027603.1 hypothetical protein [Candidatus Omnitrophota bacterium]MDD5662487.1 hypothetical protein [Candidatus Omnitrophota bacterium]
MKQIFIFIGLVFVAVVPARAASVGSPQAQGKGKFAAEAEWSYIFNTDLDFKKASRPAGHATDQPLNFKITRGRSSVAKISYGLFDFLDVYLKVGSANYNFKGDVYVGGTRTVEENLSSKDSFLYGLGFKVAHELKKGWIVGCDVQYLTTDLNLNFSATSLGTGAVANAKYTNCRIQEWHVAPYIAKKIANFTPYLGARYSDLRLDQSSPNDPNRWNNLVFNAVYNVGVFTGMDWNIGDGFKLNVEGRFIDETAVSVGVAYKF